MIVLFGALGISSLAAAIGLTTGQRYLTIAGFVLAAGAAIVHLYRKYLSTGSNQHSSPRR